MSTTACMPRSSFRVNATKPGSWLLRRGLSWYGSRVPADGSEEINILLSCSFKQQLCVELRDLASSTVTV